MSDVAYADIDRAPRLRDTMKPGDLDTDACVLLAGQILKDAAEAYVHARRAVNREPANKDARAHLATCRKFYLSEYFVALSCGMADGQAVRTELDKLAGGEGRSCDTDM